MRLLNTLTRELHEFFDEETPPYAILSHTWGKDEVSLRDLERGETNKAGYSKIKNCCELAASEAWEFVWIDTCCIDKSSSAELSEAINSMFRWYRRAQVCYAYLSDVDIDGKPHLSSSSIHGSRWFTRGWTLQELLAPATVVFYDKNWTEIGTKRSLQKEISSETGISDTYLFRPNVACIAAKMSWASKRTTARREDIAYCLLGLFDLNMPLLYGEGEKAFFRLQYELLQSGGDDESIFAWEKRESPHLRISSGILAPSPAAFASSGNIVKLDIPYGYRLVSNLTRKSMLAAVSMPEDPSSNHELRYVILNCRRIGEDGTRLVIELDRMFHQRYHVRVCSCLTRRQVSSNRIVSKTTREAKPSQEVLLSDSSSFDPYPSIMEESTIYIKWPALRVDRAMLRKWSGRWDFEMDFHLYNGYLTFKHKVKVYNHMVGMLFASSEGECFLIVILYKLTHFITPGFVVVISDSISIAEALQDFKRISTDNLQDTFSGTLQRGSQLAVKFRKNYIDNHIYSVIHVDVIGNHSVFELKDWKLEEWSAFVQDSGNTLV